MFFKKLLVPIFLLLAHSALAQQQDTVRYLPELQISEQRIPERISFKQSRFDRQILEENLTASLGELLTLKTPVFIRNYGAGGAATPSFRGTGASHTQLYWNGINLNSPMLGQIDLSMFPVSFTDEVEVNYGGASLLHGTGGLGGSINLNSRTDWDRSFYLMLSQSANSLQNYITNASLTLGNERLQSTTKLFFKNAANRFDFVNPLQPASPVWTNKHSAQQQYGLLEELNAKISKHQTLGLKLWLQQDQRELSPSMDKQDEFADLNNQVLRLLGEWKHKDAQKELIARAAYINDQRHYEKRFAGEGSSAALTSDSRINTFQLQFRSKFRLSDQWYVNSGGRLNQDMINASAYYEISTGENKSRSQQIHEAYAGAEYLASERLNMSLLLRQQWLDGERMPFLPSLGGDYTILDKNKFRLSAKANLSRNFHAPTLNDRYWGAAGNPDLLNEEGWTAESALNMQHQSSEFFQWSYELTAFASRINNWIVWQPRGSSGNLWQPINLRQVYARGLEQVFTATIKQADWRLELFASYSLSRSENQKPYSSLDESVDQQLIYTPVHNFQGYLRFKYHDYLIRLEQSVYSRRFTQTDGSEWLPAYLLTNLSIGKTLKWEEHRLMAELRTDNLFGYHYQSIARKPMPGRTFQFRLTYHLGE